MDERVRNLLMNPHFRWMNIFVRDLLIVGCVGAIQYLTNFQSKSVFFISGMLVVYLTWHINDYLNYRKILNWGKDG